ncbi:MAG: MaoC/PaaZ C-terminal domain-containing protein [Acidimicrobiales bacterium]
MSAAPDHQLVTDEVEACIGTTVSYEAPEDLDAGAIRYFAAAIGSDPARWAQEAPPTLVCETNQLTGRSKPDSNGYLGHTWDLPFPVPVDLIRGGNDYHFHHPVRPGHRILTTWTLTSVEERGIESGHRLAVATAEAAYRLPDGDLMATNTETLLYLPRPAASATPVTTAAATQVQATPRVVGTGRCSEPPDLESASLSAPTLFGGSARPAVGDRLPVLERTLGLGDLVAYGAATWDWHRIHFDTERATEAGMPGPVVDGQMFGALLAEQLTAWLGGKGRIGGLHFRNRAPVHPGATIRCEGEVVDVGRAGCVVNQRILVDGEPVVEPAGAEIRLDGAL